VEKTILTLLNYRMLNALVQKPDDDDPSLRNANNNFTTNTMVHCPDRFVVQKLVFALQYGKVPPAWKSL